jgi:hypothetical protein
MNLGKWVESISGWLVFLVAFSVYLFSAERTGSLWDCGEFILGAFKLQVVHPPGAPLFLIIGRIFTVFGSLFSDNPENIAFSVNLLSGISSAFAAMFIAKATFLLGKHILNVRNSSLNYSENVVLFFAAIISGLSTAFASAIWFSAVEGEVYALSTFFTATTLWAIIKWYTFSDEESDDRWLLFAVYLGGLSIGVHLLSLLTFPALALFYYFKKFPNPNIKGVVLASFSGLGIIVFVQSFIIVGLPKLWASLDLFMVNKLGFGFHTGLIPTFLYLIGCLIIPVLFLRGKFKSGWPLYGLGLLTLVFTFIAPGVDGEGIFNRMFIAGLFFVAGYYKDYIIGKRNIFELLIVGTFLVIIGFSTVGVVVIRANAEPPINMNSPTDAMRLIPYLNREQYGERALVKGPHFDARPKSIETKNRYGRVGNKYQVVDQKVSYIFDENDEMLFPRMGDYSQNRNGLYKRWLGLNPDNALPAGRPNMLDNLSFLFNYQIGWMYWRYFMWNFSGRQNGDQGFFPWDKSSGHWLSGIPFIDEWRLDDQTYLPLSQKNNKSRNKYYMLPFLFGLVGLFFHFKSRSKDALALFSMFIITGIGIIIYSNQPPNEPRERDYVLAGSFFTYSIWIGLAVIALFKSVSGKISINKNLVAFASGFLILIAPILMGFENFDDHSRRYLSGSRDYANNFLESCDSNAIIFTYGDNDTYPLWYAQEVEGIRTDVRVVNLSLITVDWYINLLRRKVNNSQAIKMTLSEESIRGKKRNQVLYFNPTNEDRLMDAREFLRFIGEDHPVPLANGDNTESYMPSREVFISIDLESMRKNGLLNEGDTNLENRLPLNFSNKTSIIKDELAVLDIITSNINDRPIYFAVTTRQDKLLGLRDFMQLEGLGLRLYPSRGLSEASYGIIGNGNVASNKIYDRVMNKFKWGGFDSRDLFVDDSFGPSIQSHQLIIRRAAFDLIKKGENEKAVDLIDQYFVGFPSFNFPYDYRAYYMIEGYIAAGAYNKAKEHLEILANETYERLNYYSSLRQETIRTSFENEYQLSYRIMEDMINVVRQNGDTEFVDRLDKLFTNFRGSSINN